MKLVCINDMHGNLNFKIPEADLLLIAGDLCPATGVPPDDPMYDPIARGLALDYNIRQQASWLRREFKKWLYDQPIEYAISVAGNHDWIWEFGKENVPVWFPSNIVDREIRADAKIENIEDYLTWYKGLKIYGTPVQLTFNNWAFNREEKQIQKYWDNIPEGLDILLLHSPPYGILDETKHPDYLSEKIGCKSLKKKIDEVRPRYVVFGHNHGEHGVVEKDGITYINASMVDERYNLTREPIVVEI